MKLLAMKRQLSGTLAFAILFTTLFSFFTFAYAAIDVGTAEELANALASGGAIRLAANIEGNFVIEAGKEVTLILDGHDITSTTGDAITNNGTLTINGDGMISTSANGYAAIVNNTEGTVTINGPEFYATGWQAIKNYGDMTIEDAYVHVAPTSKTPVMANGWYSTTDYDTYDRGNVPAADTAILTINGGTFTSTQDNTYVVKNDSYGILVINDGVFTSDQHSDDRKFNVIWNWNETTINGGTFTQNDDSTSMIGNGFEDADCAKGNFTITGGTFEQDNYYFLNVIVIIKATITIRIKDMARIIDCELKKYLKSIL